MGGDEMVDVKLLRKGVVIDGIAREQGETVQVTVAEEERLRARGLSGPKPKMRALRDGVLFGKRIAAKGEEGHVGSETLARTLHDAGAAEWLNARDFGVQLPQRVDQADSGRRRVRALKPLYVPGTLTKGHAVGQEFETSQDDAEKLVSGGLAEPVGDWKPHSKPRAKSSLRVRAISNHVLVGTRNMFRGQEAEVDEGDALEHLIAGRIVQAPATRSEPTPVCEQRSGDAAGKEPASGWVKPDPTMLEAIADSVPVAKPESVEPDDSMTDATAGGMSTEPTGPTAGNAPSASPKSGLAEALKPNLVVPPSKLSISDALKNAGLVPRKE